jgi:hypothetical protein
VDEDLLRRVLRAIFVAALLTWIAGLAGLLR